MPDYKQLCEELSDELDRIHYWYIEDNGCNLPDLEALLRRVNTALATHKPLSLRAQALRKLSNVYGDRKIDDHTYDTIRRALETIND